MHVQLVLSAYVINVATALDSLQPFANDIANTVDVDHILPMMVQEGLVTPDQQQFLSSPFDTSIKKQKELSNIVTRLPEDSVDKFKNCLLKTISYDPHKLLYDKLCKVQCETAVQLTVCNCDT